jgi:hypothetical protein
MQTEAMRGARQQSRFVVVPADNEASLIGSRPCGRDHGQLPRDLRLAGVDPQWIGIATPDNNDRSEFQRSAKAG